MTSLLAFLVTIGVLIVIHEYGHYRMARACGVKVLRFSVGFGQVLWRHQRAPDSTEFVICALPLGGYVRMLDEREAPVKPDELQQAFNRRPLLQRVAIVAAGPVANLLLAVLLYATSFALGVSEPKAVLGAPVAGSVAERSGQRAGDWVRAYARDGDDWHDVLSLNDLRWQVTQAVLQGEPLHLMVSDAVGQGSRRLTLDLASLESHEVDAQLMQRVGLGGPYSEALLGEVKPGGPAQLAGLRSGDRVLSVDGQIVSDSQTLRQRIRDTAREGQVVEMIWTVVRDGRQLDLQVRPRVVEEAGRKLGRIDAVVGKLPEMVVVRQDPVDALVRGVGHTWEVSALTLSMLGRMLVGEASLSNLSGPLTIADYAGQSAQLGLTYYLGFLALVSVSLGVLNLLPLPMLDGGHLMYYLFEGVTGRQVSDLWLKWLQRGGALIMLLLMSIALSNDVVRLLGPH